MSVIVEAETLALSLPVSERARLADRLILSLPANFIDDDEIKEARKRSKEMDEDPSRIISLDQLDQMIANRPHKK